MSQTSEYDDQVAREAKHWGDRLKVEGVEWNAWLDHPLIAAHYRDRKLVDGMQWEQWVVSRLRRPARKSMELGCGSASRSLHLFQNGLTSSIEGIDASPDRVALGEQLRADLRAPGQFRVADANLLTLPRDTYDLIFSCHSFHHFTALEQILDEVSSALTPDGLFVLEEFVGPTQFQWTDRQIDVVRALTTLLPERLRTLRWGAVKSHEGRPTPEQVVAVSPFESIRSGEITALFERAFDVVAVRRLGGTIQHLLYNGIIHNFAADDAEATRFLEAIWHIEDELIDSMLLPSDFLLLIGRRRTAA